MAHQNRVDAEALVARPLETAGALIVASFRKHPVRNTSVLASYLVGLGVAEPAARRVVETAAVRKPKGDGGKP